MEKDIKLRALMGYIVSRDSLNFSYRTVSRKNTKNLA